jgi:hypothetical protein
MQSEHAALILSRRLRLQGDSPRHLERGVERGEFIRIRPGAYLPIAEWSVLDARQRHLASMSAVASTSRRRLLFSDESAAAVLGIPLLGGWGPHPHIIDVAGRRRAPLVGVVTHRRMLADAEIVRVDGVDTTSPLRTALDIAASRGLLAGVVALDHVLGPSFAVGRAEAEHLVARSAGARGFRRMQRALDVATGCAESPLESLSLARIHLLGFPSPRQQVEFIVDGSRYRADFYFEEADAIGEADGRSKYGPDASPPRMSGDTLWHEKQREDSLRSVVRGFARWNWTDALNGDGLAARLERAGVRRLR